MNDLVNKESIMTVDERLEALLTVSEAQSKRIDSVEERLASLEQMSLMGMLCPEMAKPFALMGLFGRKR